MQELCPPFSRYDGLSIFGKLEANRRTIRSDVDFVIAFEELAGMFEAKGILLDEIRIMDEMRDATGAGRGYGVAGGRCGKRH